MAVTFFSPPFLAVIVSTYAQHGDSLDVVGRLENVAHDERVYSTRFDGDRAFVVTFRVVDPLFVIDLSDPAQPRVEGELKMPGFSSYLHVIDANHVIGVGFITSPILQSTRLGDHRAFFYDAESGTLGIPFQSSDPFFFWGWQEIESVKITITNGIRYFHVDADQGLTEIGQVTLTGQALRTARAGDHLVSMSDSEVKISPINDVSNVIHTIQLGAETPQERPIAGPTLDVNEDGRVTAQDVLVLINNMQLVGSGTMREVATAALQQSSPIEMDLTRIDVNHDGYFSLLDPLIVINEVILKHGQATDPTFVERQNALDSAMARWNGAAITSYELGLQVSCECSLPADITSTVSRGLITSNVDFSDVNVPVNVDRLFSMVQEAIRRNVDVLNVHYDAQHGLPLLISIDESSNTVDDERTVALTRFRSLT